MDNHHVRNVNQCGRCEKFFISYTKREICQSCTIAPMIRELKEEAEFRTNLLRIKVESTRMNDSF